MKAIIYEKFGSGNLKLKEVETPKPGKNQILVKIHAASANAYDWRHLNSDPFMIRFMGAGLFKPKHPILGADMAGVIEAVGSEVKKFKPGDEVFGEGGYGGFAEYAAVDENRFVQKPGELTFAEAAAAPMAALTALQGLRDFGMIHSGQKVLVNGASGGVGSYAVQIAKYFDTEVTGVCSTKKLDFVRLIGADRLIDYSREDIFESSIKYDLIYDTAAHHSISYYKRIMNPGGKYVLAGGSISKIFQLMLKTAFGLKNVEIVSIKVIQDDLTLIGNLLKNGNIKSMIDKIYPLEKTATAIKDLMEGRIMGKAVIEIIHPAK